ACLLFGSVFRKVACPRFSVACGSGVLSASSPDCHCENNGQKLLHSRARYSKRCLPWRLRPWRRTCAERHRGQCPLVLATPPLLNAVTIVPASRGDQRLFSQLVEHFLAIIPIARRSRSNLGRGCRVADSSQRQLAPPGSRSPQPEPPSPRWTGRGQGEGKSH